MSKSHFADIREFRPNAKDPELVVLEIGRTHVERNDLQTWVEVLSRLTESGPMAAAYEGMLSVAITGYEDDPRELYEIPEVLRYIRALTEAWPYWFHFCERPMRSLELVFMTHIDLVRVKTIGQHKIGVSVVSERQFSQAMMRLFNGLNSLYEEHGWPDARNEAASEQVNAALLRWLGS